MEGLLKPKLFCNSEGGSGLRQWVQGPRDFCEEAQDVPGAHKEQGSPRRRGQQKLPEEGGEQGPSSGQSGTGGFSLGPWARDPQPRAPRSHRDPRPAVPHGSPERQLGPALEQQLRRPRARPSPRGRDTAAPARPSPARDRSGFDPGQERGSSIGAGPPPLPPPPPRPKVPARCRGPPEGPPDPAPALLGPHRQHRVSCCCAGVPHPSPHPSTGLTARGTQDHSSGTPPVPAGSPVPWVGVPPPGKQAGVRRPCPGSRAPEQLREHPGRPLRAEQAQEAEARGEGGREP
ncbi:proline-rich protein HaeIII subfamily 1-like [Lathamus discolor]|uniref:proline-rich protein HaeIII subfamily 1-like n=1 Tax=Lathamus discolor TaxID=678569 RepID=UPI0032B7A7AF